MRRLLILVLALTMIMSVTLTSVIMSALILNKDDIPQTAVQNFLAEQCDPRPCWRDIEPGKTDLAQAQTLLKTVPGNSDNYQLCWGSAASSCWHMDLVSSGVEEPQDPVDKMIFQPAPGSFHLVDAVVKFGDPISAMLCYITTPSNGDIGPEIPRPLMIGYISFKGGIKAVVYNPSDLTARRMDMNMSVYRLYIQNGYDINVPAWHGFTYQPKLGCNMG